MFFLVNLDDVFDGFAGLTGLGIKLFIIVGLMSFPIVFFRNDEGMAIRYLLLAIIVILAIFSILAIIGAIKNILTDKDKKIKITSTIMIGVMILCGIVGYLNPLYINVIHMKFNSISTCLIYASIITTLFAPYLGKMDIKNPDNKINIIKYLKEMLIYFLKNFLINIMFFTAIIFLILSMGFRWTMYDKDFLNGKIANNIKNLNKVVLSEFVYYDESYENLRKNDFDREKIIFDRLGIEIDNMNKPEEAKKYDLDLSNQSDALYKYLISIKIGDSLKKDYGLGLEVGKLPNTDYENTYITIIIEDYMYRTKEYYFYDVINKSIVEKFEDNHDKQNRYYDYNYEWRQKKYNHT